jgi:transposase
MELTREQKRLLMLHEYKLGTSAIDATHRINQAWGEGTVGKTAVYEHYKEFKTGNEDLTDEPRSGRPREVDRQAVELKKIHR